MSLAATIQAAWDDRAALSPATTGAVRDAVEAAIAGLDDGTLRVAEPDGAGGWRINQWLKQAVLLSFRLGDNVVMPGGAWDKVPTKFAGWDASRFAAAGFRAVPSSIVRRGAYIALL